MLVELEVFHDEVEASARLDSAVRTIEPYRLILHPGAPLGILGLGLGQEVRLEPANPAVAGPPFQRVDVYADEQVAVIIAVGAAAPKIDQGIAGAGHHDLDAPLLELVSQEQRELQRDVLFLESIGEENPGIAGIDAPVSG